MSPCKWTTIYWKGASQQVCRNMSSWLIVTDHTRSQFEDYGVKFIRPICSVDFLVRISRLHVLHPANSESRETFTNDSAQAWCMCHFSQHNLYTIDIFHI